MAGMTEFELIRGLVNVGQSHRLVIAKSLGLDPTDLATEEGIKRQFKVVKAANQLDQLEKLLPKAPGS